MYMSRFCARTTTRVFILGPESLRFKKRNFGSSGLAAAAMFGLLSGPGVKAKREQAAAAAAAPAIARPPPIPSCLALSTAKMNFAKLPGVVGRFERPLSPAAERPKPAGFVSQVRTRMNDIE